MPTIALAGDTMLGRLVAEELGRRDPRELVHPVVADAMRAADAAVLNLECCVSDRGEPWPDPAKRFFFRAPPVAVKVLTHLGVDAVTLANNHALDFGAVALLDTLEHLAAAGIAVLGAGPDVRSARQPLVLDVGDLRVRVVGLTDHPAEFGAAEDAAGVAYADLARGLPAWVTTAVAAPDADLVLVTPHWGPNMTHGPVPHVRRAAAALLGAGAHLVAGHSAHVFHGVRLADEATGAVLFDLGDFLDDYAVHPELRNDLGLLWLVTVEPGRVAEVAALPLRLALARTEPATGADRDWIARRLGNACDRATVGDDGRWLRVLPTT